VRGWWRIHTVPLASLKGFHYMGDHLFDVEVMRKTMVLTCPTSRVKLSKSKMRTSPPLLVLYE